MSVSVCVCVCVFVCPRSCLRNTRPIFTNFLCVLPMAVARSSFGGVVIRYVLPALQMTSHLLSHKPRLLYVAAKLKRSADALHVLSYTGWVEKVSC